MKIRQIIWHVIQKYMPKLWFEKLYYSQYHRRYDWSNPKDLIEKQRWIMFKTDITEWTKLADKYEVRRYIEDKGYSNILVPLYGVWDNVEDIDYTKLTTPCVLKTTHGSGGVFTIMGGVKIQMC